MFGHACLHVRVGGCVFAYSVASRPIIRAIGSSVSSVGALPYVVTPIRRGAETRLYIFRAVSLLYQHCGIYRTGASACHQ